MEINRILLITLLSLCSLMIIFFFATYIHRWYKHFLKASLFSKLGSSTQIRIVHQLQDACTYMSNKKIGALITIELNTQLDNLRTDGVIIDASISSALILSIFHKSSPLHDGAMIIKNSKIKYVGTFYKITQSSISNKYGARHRAAMGISEQSDSLTIVVSEESGNISFFKDSKITKVKINDFQDVLFKLLNKN